VNVHQSGTTFCRICDKKLSDGFSQSQHREADMTNSDELPSSRRSPLQFIERLQHLIGPGADHNALREVHPADGACGIDQKLGGTRDVGAIGPSTRMQEAVASNHFRLRVGQDRKSEAQLPAVLARHVLSVGADADHAEAA